jgi:hypothetical protein
MCVVNVSLLRPKAVRRVLGRLLLAVAASLAVLASLAGTAAAKPLSAEDRAFVDEAVA